MMKKSLHSKQIFLLLSSNLYLAFQQFYPTDGFILGSSHNEKHENKFKMHPKVIYNIMNHYIPGKNELKTNQEVIVFRLTIARILSEIEIKL